MEEFNYKKTSIPNTPIQHHVSQQPNENIKRTDASIDFEKLRKSEQKEKESTSIKQKNITSQPSQNDSLSSKLVTPSTNKNKLSDEMPTKFLEISKTSDIVLDKETLEKLTFSTKGLEQLLEENNLSEKNEQLFDNLQEKNTIVIFENLLEKLEPTDKELKKLSEEGEFFPNPLPNSENLQENLKMESEEILINIEEIGEEKALENLALELTENVELLLQEMPEPDPLEHLQPIWKQLEEAENVSIEERPGKLSNALGMILGFAASESYSEVTSTKGELNFNSLIPSGHSIGDLDKPKMELKKILEKFEELSLGLDIGTEIMTNVNIIFTSIEINKLNDVINQVEQEISKKMEQLKNFPENELLKKEISALKRNLNELEEAHFNKTMQITTATVKSPIAMLQMACENLLSIFPKVAHVGLQSAVNVLSFLGGSVGVVTAAAQIHKYKNNIVKIKELKQQLMKTVEELKKQNVPERVIKIMEMRINNLSMGRMAMEVSNLVSAIFKWAGTTGSTAKTFAVSCFAVKGAIIGKVSIGLSAGTILIPAAIGAIAFLRLRRAEIWKALKSKDDKETVELADKLLVEFGEKYQETIRHPYYKFNEKVNEWKNALNDQDIITDRLMHLNEDILKNMSEEKYEEYKKLDKKFGQTEEGLDILLFANEKQKEEILKLREELKKNNKFISKFEAEYNPTVNDDTLLCDYVKYAKQLKTRKYDTNLNEVSEKFFEIQEKIFNKQMDVDSLAKELKRDLQGLLRVQRGYLNKLSAIEDQYIQKMVCNNTKLDKENIKMLMGELELLWNDPLERKEIKQYFWDNHRELYGDLEKDPIKILLKWVAGVQI